MDRLEHPIITLMHVRLVVTARLERTLPLVVRQVTSALRIVVIISRIHALLEHIATPGQQAKPTKLHARLDGTVPHTVDLLHNAQLVPIVLFLQHLPHNVLRAITVRQVLAVTSPTHVLRAITVRLDLRIKPSAELDTIVQHWLVQKASVLLVIIVVLLVQPISV